MKEVSVQELKQLKDSNANFQLIDVREEHEFDEANLGGLLIPLGDILDRASEIDKEKQVVIHCRSGKRSATAIQALETQLGFKNLYNFNFINEFGQACINR